MSTPAGEWEAYAATWRTASEPVDVARLRRLLAAQRRRLVIVALGEAAMVAAFAVLSWLVAADGIETWEAIWLLSLWGFTLVACAFAIWNRRGTWRSLGKNVEEYARLARLRVTRKARAAVFGCALFMAETVAVIAQLLWFGRLSSFAVVLLVASSGALAAGCWLFRRRLRREEELLAAFAPTSEAG